MEHIHNNFTIPCEKSKIGCFASLIMKNIIEPLSGDDFE